MVGEGDRDVASLDWVTGAVAASTWVVVAGTGETSAVGIAGVVAGWPQAVNRKMGNSSCPHRLNTSIPGLAVVKSLTRPGHSAAIVSPDGELSRTSADRLVEKRVERKRSFPKQRNADFADLTHIHADVTRGSPALLRHTWESADLGPGLGDERISIRMSILKSPNPPIPADLARLRQQRE